MIRRSNLEALDGSLNEGMDVAQPHGPPLPSDARLPTPARKRQSMSAEQEGLRKQTTTKEGIDHGSDPLISRSGLALATGSWLVRWLRLGNINERPPTHRVTRISRFWRRVPSGNQALARHLLALAS